MRRLVIGLLSVWMCIASPAFAQFYSGGSVVDAQVPDTLTLTNITGPTTLAAGTATTAVSPLAITQTWDNVATTFPGFTHTITDTASASGSLAAQILCGASGTTTCFNVSKVGQVTAGVASATVPVYSFPLNTNTGFGTSGTNTVDLYTAGTIRLRLTDGGVTQSVPLIFVSAIGVGDYASLSRIATGVVGVGTGAAGSIDGSLSLKTLTHSSAEVDTSFSYNAPATGATITPAVGEQRTIVNPAGTIATLTINTPATPVNGQIWGFGCTQIVTTLTVTAVGGATIVAAPAACAVGGHHNFLYRATGTTWYPVP